MTRQELQDLFNSLAESVPATWTAEVPTRNFQTYPEAVEDEYTDGVYYGFHYGPALDEFKIDVTTCCYDGEEFSMEEILRKESERGESALYMMQMLGDERFPVQKVRGELRQMAGLCRIKRVK